MRILTAIALSLFLVTARAQNVLSNTDHIVGDVTAAISILGGSNTVNQTCPSGSTPGVSCFSVGGPSFIINTAMIANAVNSSVAEYLAGSATSTGTPNPNVPYKVLNQSSTGYNLAQYDQNVYSQLVANDQLYEVAFCGGDGPNNTYPPIAASNILPNTVGAGSPSNLCGYGVGIEFSMTAGYKGFATGSPSGTTEAMSGVFAVLRANHPGWTWDDIKGALRQTASNWAAGYAAYATPGGIESLGFGNIDYDAANAIGSTASIYLQGPGMRVANHGYYATITLYPFLSTRRAKEAIYSVASAYTWPVKNEYTAADIAASSATLLYTSNGTDVTPIYTYSALVTGSITLVAFSLDGAGGYSRVESYSESTQSFLVGTACIN